MAPGGEPAAPLEPIAPISRPWRKIGRAPPITNMIASSPISRAIAVVIVAVVFTVLGIFVFQNASNFIGELMSRGPKLGVRIGGVISGFGVHMPAKVMRMLSRLDPTVYVGPLALSAQAVLVEGGLTLLYMGFLLVSRNGLGRKIVTLFPTHENREQAAMIRPVMVCTQT